MTPAHPSRRSSTTLGSLLAEDVGVTSVEDGHGGAAEELSAGSTQLDLSEVKRLANCVNPPEKTGLSFAGLEDTRKTTLVCPP